jgi:endonuclease/exonuclease/phosphatase family metal-dependent hydrolase
MPDEAIFMGDFNFQPSDPEYEKFVGPWSEAYGRLVPLAGFVDSWVAGGHREREGVTCDGARIDYAFLSSSLSAHIESVWIDSEADGSDHQPYWCSLSG